MYTTPMKRAASFQATLLALCCGALILANPAGAAKVSAEAMGLEMGPHRIGFRVVETYDRSRAFRPATEFSGDSPDQEWARPIQILLWYPAMSESDRAVLYRDIVEREHTQIRFQPLSSSELDRARAAHDTLMRRNFSALTEDLLDDLWNAQTGSWWNAEAAEGSFPLLVWSGNSATYNSVVCEYLASHGYVVASAPGIGRWSEEYADFVPNPVHLATQSEDLGFVVSYLPTALPWIDADRFALAGFSTTNLATILFQMKNMTASAVVSVEGHDRYASGGRTVPLSVDYDPRRFRVPLLYLEATASGHRRDTTLFDALEFSPRYLLTFSDLRHQDLTSRVAALGTLTPESHNASDAPDAPSIADKAVAAGYRTSSRYLLKFLDAYLLDESQARESLAKSPKGASLRTFAAKPALPSEAEVWAKLFEPGGVEQLTEILLAAKGRNPELEVFPERLLNRAGYALLRRQRVGVAVGVFQLCAEAYPNSSNAFDSLSEAYEAAGTMEMAIAAAEKSLSLLAQETDLEEERKKQIRIALVERIQDLRTRELDES
jgi:hypothetical protein